MKNLVIEYLETQNNLCIRFLNKEKYMYSIYGNTNISLKGIIEINHKHHQPQIIIDVADNSLFFIKLKTINKGGTIEEFMFVNIEKYKKENNLSMSILDKKTESMFLSLNNIELDSSVNMDECFNNTNMYVNNDNDSNVCDIINVNVNEVYLDYNKSLNNSKGIINSKYSDSCIELKKYKNTNSVYNSSESSCSSKTGSDSSESDT